MADEPEYVRRLLLEIEETRQEFAEGHASNMAALNELAISHAVIKSQIELISTKQAENTRMLTDQATRIAVNASLIGELNKNGFMSSDNGKYVIWAGILIIIGLLGLAGYNVNLAQFT